MKEKDRPAQLEAGRWTLDGNHYVLDKELLGDNINVTMMPEEAVIGYVDGWWSD
jgi:hypothetical protein